MFQNFPMVLFKDYGLFKLLAELIMQYIITHK